MRVRLIISRGVQYGARNTAVTANPPVATIPTAGRRHRASMTTNLAATLAGEQAATITGRQHAGVLRQTRSGSATSW